VNRCVTILLAGLCAFTTYAKDYSDCFIPGEEIRYKIYWLGIPIAWSTTTTDTVTEDGRELIRIRMVAQTYSAYKHIFEVDDTTEVVIDPETALPVRHDWIINEGTIHKSQLTTYYHDKKIAIFQDRISKDIREIPIQSDTQEIFSFIYSNRNADIKELAARKHKLLVTGRLYDLELKLKDYEDIKVPDIGDVPSIKIEPLAEFDGIFLRKGKVFFWISKENRRVVTCIKASVAVGKITAKVQDVEGNGDAIWNTQASIHRSGRHPVCRSRYAIPRAQMAIREER